MNKYLISIIIPAYNAEKTLSACLNSILPQLDGSIEVIVVNDGSKDDTWIICEEYAKKCPQIKIINKQNEGVSSARNDAMMMAQGKWLMFLDSDDRIIGNVKDCISDMPINCNLVLMGAMSFYNGQTKPVLTYIDAYYSNVNLLLIEQSQCILKHGAPWSKLFCRDIIQDHDLLFNNQLSIAEDRLFYYQYLAYVSGVKTCSQIIYSYVLSGNGLRCKIHPMVIQKYRLNMLTKASLDMVRCQHLNNKAVAVLQSALNSQCVSIIKALPEYSVIKIVNVLANILFEYSPFCVSFVTKFKLYLVRIKQIIMTARN